MRDFKKIVTIKKTVSKLCSVDEYMNDLDNKVITNENIKIIKYYFWGLIKITNIQENIQTYGK